MKKFIRYLVCALVLTLVLPLSVAAVHEDMTWQKLDAEDTFDAPYEDYKSVFDRTVEKYKFNEMEKDLFQLQEQFPDLMRLEIIGYSEFGRPLYAVVMGSDYAPNRMFVLANAHAREYTTTQMAMLQLEYYLHNYDNTINGEKVSDLFDRCQYYFVPNLNPDGAMISMEGLASLDDPRLTITAEEKAQIKAFMLSQVQQMNEQCEADVNYHDSDAKPFSEQPDPYGEDAFQYWKSNGKGIDLHYSMFTPYMLNRWQTSGSWYGNAKESHFSGPHWENATGYIAGGANNTDNGIYNSAENTALCDYINKIQPNMFMSYHTASNIVQWDYGYGQMKNPNEKRAVGKEISYKASDLLNFKTSDTQNPYVGHAGWFMLNSQNYTEVGYGVTIEWASRQYLNGVGGRASNYMDAPPTQIIQLMTDVKTDAGVQKYSLWTTGRFFPMALSQYIMDNQLINEVKPIAEKASFADVTSAYWARPQIERAFQDGAINGTSYDYITGKRTYAPENTLTLAHFVAITTRAFYAEDVAASTATGTWYAANEAVAKENGLLDGLGDVNMTAPASRYQMAAIMANIMKDKGADMPTAAELTAIQSKIADWNVIPEQYKDAVATVFALGIINGTDAKGTFAGNNSVKRSHAAAVYCRLMDAIADNEAAAKAAAAPTSAVKSVAGKAVSAAKVTTMNVGAKKIPVVVENYGTVVLDKASAATLTAADFQGAAVTLYNSDFETVKDSAYVGTASPVYFGYQNAAGEDVYGVVAVTRPSPVASIAGAAVKVGDMSGAIDKATATDPSILVASGADGSTIVLAQNTPTITAASVKTAAGYTATLYTDDTFSTVATSVALEIGKNNVYVGVTNAAGDKAFYTAVVKNVARPDDAGLRAKQDGGIWRHWEIDINAGTKADPDIVTATVNGAYFGTTNARSFSNIAEKLHDSAVVKYYTDNTFSKTCSNYTFAGGWENGMHKEAYFSITAADGKTIRYYTFVILNAQALTEINGQPVKHLGMLDPTKANSSKNFMCVEVTLPRDKCTKDTIQMPRYNGQMMGTYPNITYKTLDPEAQVLQRASIVIGGESCPEGYDAYYGITVRSPWTSQTYYQVNVKFA